MASSHIPFITGGLTHKYNNMFTFDGGFSYYPYLNKNRILHISPSMWDRIEKKTDLLTTIKTFSKFFSISKNNLLELYDDGYLDAKNNKKYLDTLFIAKDSSNDKINDKNQSITNDEIDEIDGIEF
jgi:hypothetical protein